MAIYNGTHHVIRFQSGEIWDFYAEQNKGISYRRLNQFGMWEQPQTLVSNTLEDFSVKIDSMDYLHLVCYSSTGELFYYLYNGMKWTKQVLSRYEPIRYTIRYPVIIPINNKIHIIFAIGATFSTGYWTLYHYYWDGNVWKFKEITRLTAGYRLSPFYADLSDKYIHMVYRGLATHQYQIFYCRYHLEHGIWSSPENVTQGTADCNMPTILIKDDLLHLAWVTLSKTDLVVKYKNKAIRSLAKVDWSQPVQLNAEGSNASFPRLIWAEEKLWCLWYQADNLIGSSLDRGESWSEPTILPGFENNNFHNIYYSTNQPREKELFYFQWILGNMDRNLSLPVVGPLMELPEYNPALPITSWEAYINKKTINNKETVNSNGNINGNGNINSVDTVYNKENDNNKNTIKESNRSSINVYDKDIVPNKNESKSNDTKTHVARPYDPKPNEDNPNESSTNDAKQYKARPYDPKPNEAKTNEASPNETKAKEAKANEDKLNEAKSNEANAKEDKPNEARSNEASIEKLKDESSRKRIASSGTPSLETMLFTEFDRQEEFNYSIITKLEEQANNDESILKELRQATLYAKQNYEMLQVLKNDIEHIKKDIRFFKSRGWLQRLFHNES